MLTVVCSVLPFLIALSQSTQFQAVREFTPSRLAIEGNTLENYRLLIQALPSYWRNFWNSLYVSTLAAFGAALVSGLAGFSFAVLEFPAKRLLFGVVMCTMVFPAMSTAIPYLIEMRILNWLDTPRALWLPSCVSALGVFLVRQYALNALPKTMIEAARVDGTNNWGLFRRIGLPNLMPVLITVALLVFVTSWNHLDAAFYVIQSLETRLLTDALGLLTAVQARTSFTPGGQIVSLLNPAILGASLGMLPVFLIYLLCANQLGHGLGISQDGWCPRVSLQSVLSRLQAWVKNLQKS